MKKNLAVIALIVAVLMSGAIYEEIQANKSHELMEQLRAKSNGSKFKVESEREVTIMEEPVTEIFEVVSLADEGYVWAESLSEETQAPYGYILDDKYAIGDIVEVTYDDDEIFNEKLIDQK